jgi:hypothetical protein
LYRLYGEHEFKDIVVDEATDFELSNFIKETHSRGPKFSNYSADKIEHFVSRIYELRKNNSNNTAG